MLTEKFEIAQFDMPNEVLMVVGDVHGQREALVAALTQLGNVTTGNARRRLVFLGDLIDRGPDSRGCLDVALNQAQHLARADVVHHLPGNHELMMVNAMQAVFNTTPDIGLAEQGGQSWLVNGGMAFVQQVLGRDMRDTDDLKRFHDALPVDNFEALVSGWDSHVMWGDVVCVHAGVDAAIAVERSVGKSHASHLTDPNHWAWIRDAFLLWDGPYEDLDGRAKLVVHGHTIPLAARHQQSVDTPEKLLSTFVSPNRICVDGGAASGTGVAAVMMTQNKGRLIHAPC